MGGIIAILCAGILTLTAGIGSSWFTNGNIKTWFNSWGKGKQEITSTPDNENNVIITPDDSNGLIQLTSAPLMLMSADGVERVVPDSYVITAIAETSDSTAQRFTWSYAFADNSSEWASGKNVNDYGSFAVSSDTKKLTVKAKQAFGEPIVITATSAVSLNASASCEMDYIKRVSSATFVVNKGGSNMFELGNSNNFEIIPTYSVGTVAGDFSIGDIRAFLSSRLRDYMTVTLGNEYVAYANFKECVFTSDMALTPFSFMDYAGYIPYESAGQNTYNEMLRRANTYFSASNDCYLEMTVDYTYSFNGNEVQSGTTLKTDTKYSAGSLTPYTIVENVSLDETHIYF